MNIFSNMKDAKRNQTKSSWFHLNRTLKLNIILFFIHFYYYYDFLFIQTLSHTFSEKYLGKVHLIFRLRKLQNNKGNKKLSKWCSWNGKVLGRRYFLALSVFNSYCLVHAKNLRKYADVEFVQCYWSNKSYLT